MTTYDYDLFVIGAGSGGVRAARISAAFGARVAVCEDLYLGGTCVNVGCVPKKLMVYGSHLSSDFAGAAGFGWTVGEPTFRWETLIGNKDKEISRLNGIYRNLLESPGVEIIDGRGTVRDPHTVEVGGKPFTAEHILVATGSWPFMPDLPGVEHAISSNEVFHLKSMPERVMIGGGGYIAVEFAGIFHGLGAQVTQLYRGPLFMRGFDDDVRAFLRDEMTKTGINLEFNTHITQVEKTGEKNGKTLGVTLTDGRQMETDCLLLAVGRVPNTRGLGLESAGVELSPNGAVLVDAQYRSNVPSILALGDVIDGPQLTPVAIAEGMAVARTLFGGQPTTVDYANIPTAVFCQPTIGTVGLTEAEAREKFGAVTVFLSTFTPMKHTMTGLTEKSLMKLVVEEATDKVVGCHMVGPDAGEIIQGIAIAIKCGATKAQFDSTIGIHPTAAEEFVTMRTPVA